ncbi:lipoyl synthase [Thermoproteota archaeon]
MTRLPSWYKTVIGKKRGADALNQQLGGAIPNCICQEAKCPNRAKCFEKGQLTFLILGKICTRNCRFCNVTTGKPLPPDLNEADSILSAVEKLNLRFVVITSPTRDDLEDGGAGHYANIINAIKSAYPTVRVEVLIPDFKGSREALEVVLRACPDVLNHNLETVPRLYESVRAQAEYQQSLELLFRVKEKHPERLTKTGLMVGLGETLSELEAVFQDIYNAGVDILTIGQYLKPSHKNHEVIRYYTIEEFEYLKSRAGNYGIRYVFSGPLVRSSYMAEDVFKQMEVMDNDLK